MDAKLQRFTAICRELGIDPRKLMSSKISMLPQLAQDWNEGKIDDIKLMRALRNLAIFNPGIKK
jgi:hypothetical protein